MASLRNGMPTGRSSRMSAHQPVAVTVAQPPRQWPTPASHRCPHLQTTASMIAGRRHRRAAVAAWWCRAEPGSSVNLLRDVYDVVRPAERPFCSAEGSSHPWRHRRLQAWCARSDGDMDTVRRYGCRHAGRCISRLQCRPLSPRSVDGPTRRRCHRHPLRLCEVHTGWPRGIRAARVSRCQDCRPPPVHQSAWHTISLRRRQASSPSTWTSVPSYWLWSRSTSLPICLPDDSRQHSEITSRPHQGRARCCVWWWEVNMARGTESAPHSSQDCVW